MKAVSIRYGGTIENGAQEEGRRGRCSNPGRGGHRGSAASSGISFLKRTFGMENSNEIHQNFSTKISILHSFH